MLLLQFNPTFRQGITGLQSQSQGNITDELELMRERPSLILKTNCFALQYCMDSRLGLEVR